MKRYLLTCKNCLHLASQKEIDTADRRGEPLSCPECQSTEFDCQHYPPQPRTGVEVDDDDKNLHQWA